MDRSSPRGPDSNHNPHRGRLRRILKAVSDPYAWGYDRGQRLKRAHPGLMLAYNIAALVGFVALMAWAALDWHSYTGFWHLTGYVLLGLAPINVFSIARNAVDIRRRFMRN